MTAGRPDSDTLNRFRALRTHIFWVTLAACAVFLSGCNTDHGLLGPAGPIAEEQQNLFFFVLFWMLVVSVPFFIALPIILYRYRHGARSSAYQPKWSFSTALEILVWGVPAVVLVILSGELWRATYDLDPYKPIASNEQPLDIEVVGLDWKWLFLYPDEGIATVNQLVLPVNRPVTFHITSGTVLQSFIIPRLGGQIYAMPGMVSQLNLLADHTGDYRGLNTQYNGDGFSRQNFTARVISDQDFGQWIADTKQMSGPLDAEALDKLTQQSVLEEPLSFGSIVSNDLFSGFAGSAHHRHTPLETSKSEHKEAH